MAKQTIFLGNTPNDRTGDPLRTAFEKVNDNFDELYARTNDDIQIPALTGNNDKVLTVSAGALSWATVNNDRLVSGSAEVVLFTDGPEPYTLFPAISTDDQLQIVGSEISSVSGDIALTSPTDTLIISNGAGVGGGSKLWTFGANGNLTLPSGGGSSSFTATTSTGVSGNSKEFASGGAVDSVTTSWTATGGGIVGTAAITNVTVGLSFTFVTFDQSFTATGPITFSSGENNTSGAIHQITTRTVTQGITTVEADTSGIVFSANAWQTGFKLVIMVETRLDDNVDNVDHTQVCEAIIAANYNSSTEPSMSVYGLTYTSPNPLATFTVQRTGYTSGGSGTIEVVATNVQTQYDLQVSVHAVQFGSSYD